MDNPGTVLSFSREIAEQYGIAAALLYQELRRKYFYWKGQGKLNSKGMFWCDQGEIAKWVLVHPNTISKAAKVLEEAGLIVKKTSYRPGTLTPTTWWGLLISESTKNVISSNHTNCDFYIKTTTKATTLKEITKEGFQEEGEDVATILPLPQLLATISQLVRAHNRREKEKLFFDKKKMEANYTTLKEKLEDAGLDFGKKEVEQVFKRALDSINDADSKANYLAGTNQVDVFFHPNNIQHFLISGEVKEYDETTTRAYNWIINHGYAKDVADIKAREEEIYKQVVDNEEYQRILRGM